MLTIVLCRNYRLLYLFGVCAALLTACGPDGKLPADALQDSSWSLISQDGATVYHNLLAECVAPACGAEMRYGYWRQGSYEPLSITPLGALNSPQPMGKQVVQVAIRPTGGAWQSSKTIRSYLWSQAPQIGMGDEFVCAQDNQQQIHCSGANEQGQLGFGDVAARQAPLADRASSVPGLTSVRQVVAGGAHACAFASQGTFCWGSNTAGQLGSSATAMPNLQPASNSKISALDGIAVQQMILGNLWSAALTESGDVWLWGKIGSQAIRSIDKLPPLDSAVLLLAGGANHLCALSEQQKLFCLGANGNGQLGTAGTDFPTWQAVSLPANVRPLQIVAGGNNTCIVWDTGQFSCLGELFGNQPDTATWSAAPLWLPGNNHVAVAAAVASQHGCVLREDGKVVCFGSNAFLQLGMPEPSKVDVLPNADGSNLTVISGIGDVIGLGLGGASTCMLEQSGLIGCIGRNNVGQLGVGGTADRNVPDLSNSLPAASFASGVLVTAP